MLQIAHLKKDYSTPAGPLKILDGVTLEFERGDAISIVGPSGSGKSTLLYICGGLDTPTAGTVTLDDQNPHTLAPKELAKFRNRQIGFVFQDHCLLPQCNVLENVLAPTLVADSRDGFEERAKMLLARVGLSERLGHLPSALSGGEKQRVAIARALIREPRLLLCDEPTGNLDRASAETVGNLLREMQGPDAILIVVTHSGELAAKFPKRYELRDHNLVAL